MLVIGGEPSIAFIKHLDHFLCSCAGASDVVGRVMAVGFARLAKHCVLQSSTVPRDPKCGQEMSRVTGGGLHQGSPTALLRLYARNNMAFAKESQNCYRNLKFAWRCARYLL